MVRNFYLFLIVLLSSVGLTCAAYPKQEKNNDNDQQIYIDPMDKSRWMVRLRAISVDPDENSTVTGLVAEVSAKSKVTPELDFTYFFTNNIAAELILATSKHDMRTNTSLNLGKVTILPPTLTLQYHFHFDERFKPYVGAGINYTVFYNEDAGSDINDIDYDNSFGTALQAGFDFSIDNHWALNMDVKKVFLPVNVSINSGAITADVDLNPWIVGVGAAYRF